jgi:hypothetical protein
MHPHDWLVQRIRQATDALLAQQPMSHEILEWCDQYEKQCSSISASRGIAFPSIAIVGAKGQGKTWIARQFVLDPRIAQGLPSGVLSSEATTHLHWVGPLAPEALDPNCELYHPCRSEDMISLGRPYMLLDTPGITDDDQHAAKIAKDAMGLSPIKLLVVRRDQLRGAIVSQLASSSEGAICVPVITSTPLSEFSTERTPTVSLRRDVDSFCLAMRASAPTTKFLDAIFVADFEADGDEPRIGKEFVRQLQQRLQNESLDDIAATRSNRLAAASSRLRHRVGQLVDVRLPQLSEAVRKLHNEADALPSQTIEAVLGSRITLHSAVRGRLRTQMIADTSLVWFPYRTVLTLLGLTQGAWDRLLLSLSGSVPSIFGTFAAWARNVQQSQKIHWEMHEGIKERLNRQMQDRLEPLQAQFQRAVVRMQGNSNPQTNTSVSSTSPIRLGGVEELQSRARSVFEWIVDRHQLPSFSLQIFGFIGTLMFWALMAGPIVWIYRRYFSASYQSLAGTGAEDLFPSEIPTLLMTSAVLSLLPMLIYAMLVLSWALRKSKIHRIAENAYSEEIKLVEELKRTGVISLHYDNPLLEHAEFLVNCRNETASL